MKKQVICPLCMTTRLIYEKKHVGVLDLLVVIFAFGLIGWAWDPYKIGFFLMAALCLIMLLEVLHQFQWRQSRICHECGFDPFLYLQNPELAAQKVKETLQKRMNDPSSYLKPPLRIPIRVKGPKGYLRWIRNGDPQLLRVLLASKRSTSQEYRSQEQNREQAKNAQSVAI